MEYFCDTDIKFESFKTSNSAESDAKSRTN